MDDFEDVSVGGFMPYSSLISAKIWSAIFIILVGSVAFLPMFFKWYRPQVANQHSKLATLINSFTGGVFLAAGLVHMLKEAAVKLQKESGLPLAYMCTGFGFLIMFSIEQLADWWVERKCVCKTECDAVGNEKEVNEHTTLMVRKDSHSPSEQQRSSAKGELISFALLLGFGFHAFFEGLALGMQEYVDDIAATSLAILLHKGFECFIVGTSLTSISGLRTHVVLFLIFIFVMITPLGVLVGALVSSISSPAFQTFKGVCLSLSAGTFMFLAVIELQGHSHAVMEPEEHMHVHDHQYNANSCPSVDHVRDHYHVPEHCHDDQEHSHELKYEHDHGHIGGHHLYRIGGGVIGFMAFNLVEVFSHQH
eukprot:Nk52_evm1s2465 gene=Nk52_evmTU1s2465